MRLVPLLARRAAELPRWRVHAQLRADTPGVGAELTLEPDAWRTGRAGDLPYDLVPDPVPVAARAPAAGLKVTTEDQAARIYARAALIALRESGAADLPELAGHVEQLDALSERAGGDAATTIADTLLGALGALSVTERGIESALSARLEAPLSGLAELGLRQPAELLADIEAGEAEVAAE